MLDLSLNYMHLDVQHLVSCIVLGISEYRVNLECLTGLTGFSGCARLLSSQFVVRWACLGDIRLFLTILMNVNFIIKALGSRKRSRRPCCQLWSRLIIIINPRALFGLHMLRAECLARKKAATAFCYGGWYIRFNYYIINKSLWKLVRRVSVYVGDWITWSNTFETAAMVKEMNKSSKLEVFRRLAKSKHYIMNPIPPHLMRLAYSNGLTSIYRRLWILFRSMALLHSRSLTFLIAVEGCQLND